MNFDLICLGTIISAHGIKGAIKIKTFTEKPENIFLYKKLINNNKTYIISPISIFNKNIVIAKVIGINSREKAEFLKNKKLFIKRNELPKIDNENEFYQSDLIKMEVRLKNNKLYGYIKNIHNFGSVDILEISIIDIKKNIMLPFTKEIFPFINIIEKYIMLNMPEFIN